MKIEIKEECRRHFIHLEGITQLCGVNFHLKDFILTSIIKHFSGSKYKDFEDIYINNILLDEEAVGREYFHIINIHLREDIFTAFKISKNSMIAQHIKEYLESFHITKKMEEIKLLLDSIFNEINEEALSSFSNIHLDYEDSSIFEIIQNSSIENQEGNPPEALSNYELIYNLLELIWAIGKRRPKKELVLFKNIDHLLSYEEYKKIYKKAKELTNKLDIYFIFTTSVSGYVVINEEDIKGIHILNDITINLERLEDIKDFISRNYPYHKEFTKEELLLNIKDIIQDIGINKDISSLKSKVMLKIINRAYLINTPTKEILNDIEGDFLLDDQL